MLENCDVLDSSSHLILHFPPLSRVHSRYDPWLPSTPYNPGGRDHSDLVKPDNDLTISGARLQAEAGSSGRAFLELGPSADPGSAHFNDDPKLSFTELLQ